LSGITNYAPYSKNIPPPPTVFRNEDILGRFSEFKIPNAGAFIPERLEIRGSSNKDKDSRRIIILGKDKMHYKVFKLPGADTMRRTAAADEDVPMS
jgi:anaphase-promoting complex subunit 4